MQLKVKQYNYNYTQKSINLTETNNMETIKKLSDNFVNSEKVQQGLDLAFNTNKNIILYGRGGHAKSQMAEQYFINKGITPFIQICGAGLQIEALLGGFDLKLFNETGKQNYLTDNSFMEHEYVILEEMLDTPMHILEIFKDILTSKKFRNGNQLVPIKTRMFVVCTNKTKEEVSTDHSIAALMERFPLSLRVEWDSYMRNDYRNLFMKVMHNTFDELASLIEVANEKGNFISPRTAIHAADVYKVNGIPGLEFIEEFPYAEIQEMAEELKAKKVEEQQIVEITRLMNQLKAVLGSFNSSNPTDNNMKVLKQANHLYETLNNMPFPDVIYSDMNDELQQLKATMEANITQIIKS